mmetsp:Transcript_66670/g.184228  ORF Transcript_66670/g.184228 Transcript_66670/m.184228 type:complete len:200 (-) Transcript_66670:496-1095(-)
MGQTPLHLRCSMPGSMCQLDATRKRCSLRDGRIVQRCVDGLLIFVHGLRPVEVLVHCVALHLPELRRLLHVQFSSPVQDLLHLLWRQRRHVEACGRLCADRDVLDRVDQAAGGVHHRQGAIPLRVHLRQAAGLIAGGHQEQVACPHQEVLHLGVEAHIPADATLVCALRPSQSIGVLPLPIAHHNDLATPCHAITCILY